MTSEAEHQPSELPHVCLMYAPMPSNQDPYDRSAPLPSPLRVTPKFDESLLNPLKPIGDALSRRLFPALPFSFSRPSLSLGMSPGARSWFVSPYSSASLSTAISNFSMEVLASCSSVLDGLAAASVSSSPPSDSVSSPSSPN